MSFVGMAVPAGALADFGPDRASSLVVLWLVAIALMAIGYLLCGRSLATRVRPGGVSPTGHMVGRYAQLLGVLVALYAGVVTVVALVT